MDLGDRIAAIYGPAAVPEIESANGVVHVTAVWQRPDGGSSVLAINESTPRSPTDVFVLRLARARADAIVTTGKILRDEPDVTFTLDGPDVEILTRWRRDRRGRTQPPTVAIFTSGRGLDANHPAFERNTVVYSGPKTIDVPDRTRLVNLERPSIRAVVDHLRRAGHEMILIETGPSTAVDLYASPMAVDELLLSELHAETIDANAVAAEFIARPQLEERFSAGTVPQARIEHEHRWTFSRLSAPR